MTVFCRDKYIKKQKLTNTNMNTNEMIAYIQRLEAENAKLKQYVKECHGIIEYLNNENNKWSDEYNIEHDLTR